jgi:hypothetical protein
VPRPAGGRNSKNHCPRSYGRECDDSCW